MTDDDIKEVIVASLTASSTERHITSFFDKLAALDKIGKPCDVVLRTIKPTENYSQPYRRIDLVALKSD